MIQEDDKFYIPENIQSMSIEEIRLEKERIYKEIIETRERKSENDNRSLF